MNSGAPGRTKVFGIGLSRTGTTSLGLALNTLGWNALHYADDPVTARELRRGCYHLSAFGKHDALLDTPVPALFPQFDAAWPDSLFILTVRDRESWLASCERLWATVPTPQPGSIVDQYRLMQYGVSVFSRARFGWVYDRHLEDVYRYFSGPKRRQLLEMNVAQGDGWASLCRFLDVPEPSGPFPHENALPADHSRMHHDSALRQRLRRGRTFAARYLRRGEQYRHFVRRL